VTSIAENSTVNKIKDFDLPISVTRRMEEHEIT
jgi:hypothetical protein